MSIKSIQYYGGKSNVGKGKWIADLLPIDDTATYVETHAGMLGVLLQRPPVNIEWATDLNERLVNWWDIVRERPDDLVRLASRTPHSRALFERCVSTLDEGDALERAWKYWVTITQSLFAGDGRPSWYKVLKPARPMPHPLEHRIAAISERIRRVQIDCQPAIDTLAKIADRDYAVVYVDPPYADTSNIAYSRVRFDRDETFALLQAQKGRVAISGFDEEWDDLGWVRNERVKSAGRFVAAAKKGRRRIEVLWTNYQPDHQRGLI